MGEDLFLRSQKDNMMEATRRDTSDQTDIVTKTIETTTKLPTCACWMDGSKANRLGWAVN